MGTTRRSGSSRAAPAAVRGLRRRPAPPVDRRRGAVPRHAARDPRVARDVAALFTRLRDTTTDDVVDDAGVDVVALDDRAQAQTEQVGGMPLRQRALALAERSAGDVDDHRFTYLTGHQTTSK